MTICALLLARQFYDLEPSAAPEVRDARPAVRQRLDRRHADALRGAAGADGGAAVGLGHAVHARPLRLARGAGDRRLDAGLLPAVPARAARRWPTRPPSPDVERAATTRPPARGARCPCPPWITAVAPRVHGVDGRQRALPGAVPRRLPVLPRLRARDRRVSEPHRAARRRCSSASSSPAWSSTAACRAGGSRRCSRSLSETPLFLGATLLTAFNDNALITYLATLVPDLERAR